MVGIPNPNHVDYLMAEYNQALSIDPGKQGDTELVQMEVDIGTASHCWQPVRHMPYAVRPEFAKQLKDMQQSGVIRHSSSLWASPVMMVRKKDGSHQFCVHYRLCDQARLGAIPTYRVYQLYDTLYMYMYLKKVLEFETK